MFRSVLRLLTRRGLKSLRIFEDKEKERNEGDKLVLPEKMRGRVLRMLLI